MADAAAQPAEPGLKCGVAGCSETFPSVRSRAAHLKKHSKGVQCPICRESTRQLSAHIRREHPADDLDLLERTLRRVVDELREYRSLRLTGAPAVPADPEESLEP